MSRSHSFLAYVSDIWEEGLFFFFLLENCLAACHDVPLESTVVWEEKHGRKIGMVSDCTSVSHDSGLTQGHTELTTPSGGVAERHEPRRLNLIVRARSPATHFAPREGSAEHTRTASSYPALFTLRLKTAFLTFGYKVRIHSLYYLQIALVFQLGYYMCLKFI